MSEKKKVFISWSGTYTREIAKALREWLKELYDNVEPFVSDQDIQAGARSLPQIEKALEGTSVGIILVTPENQNAQWLNFEAGALSKEVDNADSRVMPLLFGMKSSSELVGPLAQFQAKKFEREGMEAILEVLSGSVDADRESIAKRVDRSWSDFEEKVNNLQTTDVKKVTPKRGAEDIAEETLLIVRELQKHFSNSIGARRFRDPARTLISDFMRQAGMQGPIREGPQTLSGHGIIEIDVADDREVRLIQKFLAANSSLKNVDVVLRPASPHQESDDVENP